MIVIKNKHGKVIYKSLHELMRLAVREAVLNNVDLSGADLRGIDLSATDLRYGNFKNANFRGANLSYTDFSYADLTCANLNENRSNHAIFKGAKLHGATWNDY